MTTKQKILAIDPGTALGWALKDGDKTTHGTVKLGKTTTPHGERLCNLQDWLAMVGQVDVIAYEDVKSHKGVIAAHVYGQIVGVLLAWAHRSKAIAIPVPVQSAKMTVSGRGNASKEEVMAGNKLAGFSPQDHNASDALAVLHAYLRGAVVLLSPPRKFVRPIQGQQKPRCTPQTTKAG